MPVATFSVGSWLYRIRPSVVHEPFEKLEHPLAAPKAADAELTPQQLRWGPIPHAEADTDFLDGLVTMGTSGDPASKSGIAIHVYRANKSMTNRALCNADGDFLIGT